MSSSDLFYRLKFPVGETQVVMDISPRRYREHHKKDGQFPSTAQEHREKKGKLQFAEILRLLLFYRPGDLAQLINSSPSLYFLDAHGTGSHRWYARGGEDERRVNIQQHLEDVIAEESCGAAILTSCNPSGLIFPTSIPLLYSAKDYSTDPDDWFENCSRLYLPKAHSENRNPNSLLLFLRGLFEIEKEGILAATHLPSYLRSEKLDRYERKYQKIEREISSLLHYDPKDMLQHEGKTFTTVSGHVYSIKNGSVFGRQGTVFKPALFGGITERKKDQLTDNPLIRFRLFASYLSEDHSSHTIEAPTFGHCLFIGTDPFSWRASAPIVEINQKDQSSS